GQGLESRLGSQAQRGSDRLGFGRDASGSRRIMLTLSFVVRDPEPTCEPRRCQMPSRRPAGFLPRTPDHSRRARAPSRRPSRSSWRAPSRVARPPSGRSGDRDALESLLAEQPASYLDDPRAIFRRLLPAYFHAFSPSALDKLYDIHHQYTNHDRYHITGGGLETEVRQRRATSKPQWFRRPAPLEPTRHFPMADFDARPLLMTETASVWDVACRGACKHRSDEEYVAATHLVFTYRGVYVHHVGRAETVAEANQAVILNENEPYRVSHP